MAKELHFYRCEDCGHMLVSIAPEAEPIATCGPRLKEITAGEHDGAVEKHLPVTEAEEGFVKVKVGDVPHPMTHDHHIEWILLETDRGYHLRRLEPEDDPSHAFPLAKGERAVMAYEYCNLHGLWRNKVEA